MVPAVLILLWWKNRDAHIWLMWGAILVAMRFMRTPPVYDERPLNFARVALAIVALIVMILCFMPVPFWQASSN